METFDAIVVGVGGVGSAALYHFARRGQRVVGIDRFSPGHDRGSSHGQTRIIRRAYFEHPDYVPLCQDAYDEWARLEQHTGQSLWQQTGLLQVGPAEGDVVQGVLASARQHALEIEQLTADEVVRRFAGFRVPDGMCGVYEPGAGFLRVERCVEAYAQAAEQRGAVLKVGETVQRWSADADSVTVETDREKYSAGQLVIAAGAWAPRLLADLGIPLVVRRKPLLWFACGEDDYRADRGTPAFLYEMPEGVFYGFPNLGSGEIKTAEHSGGHSVDDPLHVDRKLHPADCEPMQAFLAAQLPRAGADVVRHSVCMYTLTADQHFVVDRYPEHPQVGLAAGLSGHGFKFVGTLGRSLVELLLDGAATAPIGFLNCRRTGLMD